jgi:hypothetical protein
MATFMKFLLERNSMLKKNPSTVQLYGKNRGSVNRIRKIFQEGKHLHLPGPRSRRKKITAKSKKPKK